MRGGHRIPGLLQALREAFAARDAQRVCEAIDALLPLTRAATDPQGIAAYVETLAFACQISLAAGDLKEGERWLGELKARLAEVGGTALSGEASPWLAVLEADVAALRTGGVAHGDFAVAFFETAGRLLSVDVGSNRTPEAAECLLRQVAALPSEQAREGLNDLVALTYRIAEHRFRSGNRGEVLVWLDAVEPFIPLCEPEAALNLAGGWSSLYRNTALHDQAEQLAIDATARFEELIAAIPPPEGAERSAWGLHKVAILDWHLRLAALDHAMVLRRMEEIAPAARAVLSSSMAGALPPTERQQIESLAAGERPLLDALQLLDVLQPPVPGDLACNISRFTQAIAQLHAGRAGEAGELLATLLAGGAEQDGDLCWGVPLVLTQCLIDVADESPGFLTAATSLLKEAVRQLERRKLETVAAQAPDLRPATDGMRADAYRMLRDMLLQQGRIGEAVRVETLRVEQACRLPSAADQSLRDLAEDRLPGFPAEREHWLACQRNAALLRPGEGGRWLERIVAEPPELDLAREAGVGGQLPSAGEVSLGFIAVGDEILTVARTPRGIEHRSRNRIAATAFYQALLKLQMAIRNEPDDAKVAALAETLGAILFDPLTDLFRQEAPRRLLIEPTGAICHVPFNALRVEGTWLAERFEILMPGGWQTPTNDDAASDCLVSICVSQNGREQVLPWVEKDRDAINAFAKATGMTLRTIPDAEARRRTVLDLLANPPRMLHFSSHFDANIVDMAKSAFRLADGERLTVEDLSRCPLLGCDLALLLGCETASRPTAALDSAIVGVDAALLRLGVRSVVSAQWPVDDQASHFFLKALLAALREPGMSKASAVRQAQMAVMHSGISYFRHPAHWAAFTLVGQG